MAMCQGAFAEDPFIAGIQPDQRPSGFPVIAEVQKPADWSAKALYGVTEPYPVNLEFLQDQGAWYTPFAHPGMTGPYDIRGWHHAK